MDRIIILYAKTNIMSNDATNESEKILESLFEPDNAEILVELKDGPKLLSFLTKKIAISKEELDEKLSYLIEKGFISKNEKNEVYTTASYITTEGIKETIDQASISITPVKYETIKSGETNRTVPTAWQIRIPKKNINATVAAFKKNQWNDSLFPYYEGRVKISGSHSGSGFMELTGY